jgi:hypothetical protein
MGNLAVPEPFRLPVGESADHTSTVTFGVTKRKATPDTHETPHAG